jgi:chemotaxis protein methyltransferase CheR
MGEGAKYTAQIEDLEIDLLVQAIERLHGISLRESAVGPVRKRIWEAIRKEKARNVSGLQEKLLHDSAALERFLRMALPSFVPYSAGFLQKFRFDLVPLLRTYPFIRIWQVGCTSVFETYCLAIILLEEGVYEKSVIYCTEVNDRFLQECSQGVFLLSQLDKHEKTYMKSGGRVSLAEYFSGGGKSGMFDPVLRRNMVFSKHSLSTDSSFNECNAIFCRNPLKGFPRPTRERAHRILHESLIVFGILGLTQGDSLESAETARCYEEFDPEYNLYRKIA